MSGEGIRFSAWILKDLNVRELDPVLRHECRIRADGEAGHNANEHADENFCIELHEESGCLEINEQLSRSTVCDFSLGVAVFIRVVNADSHGLGVLKGVVEVEVHSRFPPVDLLRGEGVVFGDPPDSNDRLDPARDVPAELAKSAEINERSVGEGVGGVAPKRFRQKVNASSSQTERGRSANVRDPS